MAHEPGSPPPPPSVRPSGDDIGSLLAVLPDKLRAVIDRHPEVERILEVVLDLGRRPEARFPGATVFLDEQPAAYHAIGIGMIFGGIWLNTRRTR